MDILNQLYHEKETYAIIGAAIEVHNELGPGFHEQVYQEALEMEFIEQGIPYEREKNLKIHYKGIQLKKEYAADFFCFDKIVVELKALSEIKKENQSQLLNYLTATKTHVGLILNFGSQSLQRKRMIK